jgi:hypothetical protein
MEGLSFAELNSCSEFEHSDKLLLDLVCVVTSNINRSPKSNPVEIPLSLLLVNPVSSHLTSTHTAVVSIEQ